MYNCEIKHVPTDKKLAFLMTRGNQGMKQIAKIRAQDEVIVK